MKSARLFIRDDDVWTLDKKFRFFFDLAIDCELPVIYAVIPAKMDRDLVCFLRRAKERTPHLLDIVQHGWRHANYAVGDQAKYEFGALRAEGAQQEDIRQGLKKMQGAFGKFFTPAFVPPYHSYDKRTLKILQKEGFRMFSAGNRKFKKRSAMLEFPVKISFTRYEKGGSFLHSSATVLRGIVKGIYRDPLLGVVIHHADFTNAASRNALTRFFECLRSGKIKMGWRIMLFSNMHQGNVSVGRC